MDRRGFLKLTGGTLAAGAGLGLSQPVAGARRPSLRSLARRLRGPIVLPGDPGYAAACRMWNTRFSGVRPRAIAFCEIPRDVARVIEFARETDLPFAARSGRHSFEGYSTTPGIVIAVSRMRGARIDRERATARIGAGADILDIYRALPLRNGVWTTVGTCPTVGIAGFALGGGLGRLMRLHGPMADNMLDVEMVLADGRVVHAERRRNADLFWACRGGGGGNFGVATAFTVRTFPATAPVTLFDLTWPYASAAEVVAAWQDWAPGLPDEVALVRLFLGSESTSTGTRVSLRVGGQFHGSADDMRDLLAPLLAPAPSAVQITTVPAIHADLPDGCTLSGTTASVSCKPTSGPSYQKSAYVRRRLSAAGIQTLIDAIPRWPGGDGAGFGQLQLEAYGGAIRRVAPEATAFVHRDALYHLLTFTSWRPGAPHSVQTANVDWAQDTYDAMAPFVSQRAYQNYIDRRLTGWADAYYGQNLRRLRQIKTRYDPDNAFRFAQSIRPLPARRFTG